MKTQFANPETISRAWHLADANDVVLGRLATKIAATLRGKHKPMFSPHVDTGDFVVVVNAEKIKVSGAKEENKLYWRHTQYPGGERSVSLQEQRERFPTRIIEHAVRGMLPKGPLGRKMFRKLKVYAGDTHPHLAQQPTNMAI